MTKTNDWFTTDLSLDEGKARFRKLVKENHPDVGGNATITASIIECFEQFCKWKMAGAFAEAGDTKTSNFNANVFADTLAEVMKFNCRIELIGFWIYAFDSYEVKDELKALGFWFSGAHKAWIYNGGAKLKRRSFNTTDKNRDIWGSQIVREREERKQIA